MTTLAVIAPHPDDETLGCGGVLLKHKRAGFPIHWIVVTEMRVEEGYSPEAIAKRRNEIERVREFYRFDSVHSLGFPAAKLDTVPRSELVMKLQAALREIKPTDLYLPFPGDIHSDHRVVFEAASSAAKWFRQSSVRRILAYETLSETEFGIDPLGSSFRPNVFTDISAFMDQKIKAMSLYGGEMGSFPFPRSEQAIRALASLRGATSGVNSAEAFQLLKETIV